MQIGPGRVAFSWKGGYRINTFYDCEDILILEEGGPFLKSDILGFLLTSFHSLKNIGISSFVVNH